jgi:oligo-alginate lyase
MIDHGPHGGAHGHYDKLNIVLFANGQEWLLDPGRLSYSHKEYKTWVKHTAAHNTVTLGGVSQSATPGKLLWFKDDKNFTACATESDEAYAGARLRRYLLLADNVLIDVFDVQAARETQIDLLAHAISQKVVPAGERGNGQAIVPGNGDGYQHLANGTSWTVAKPSPWEFHAGPKKLRLWLDGLSNEEIIARQPSLEIKKLA